MCEMYVHFSISLALAAVMCVNTAAFKVFSADSLIHTAAEESSFRLTH